VHCQGVLKNQGAITVIDPRRFNCETEKPPKLMFSAIVLAAGMSTRMGQNKLLLIFKHRSLIAHAVDTLLASEVDEVIVVLGHEAEKVAKELEGKPVKLVQNPDYQSGQSTSVQVGVSAVSPHARGILICLADQPLVRPEDVNRLIGAFVEAKKINKNIVVPFYNGRRGNPVVLDSSYREAILEIAGDIGCKRVIKRYPDNVQVVEMEADHVVRDIDRIEDYQKAVRS
jgi:molybdenum cofactor cytidylyltransferase